MTMLDLSYSLTLTLTLALTPTLDVNMIRPRLVITEENVMIIKKFYTRVQGVMEAVRRGGGMIEQRIAEQNIRTKHQNIRTTNNRTTKENRIELLIVFERTDQPQPEYLKTYLF